MTEERNCLNCGYYNADRCERYDGCCFHHSKWQPIQKAPSFQMTEEEARVKLNRIIPWGLGLIESRNEEAFLSAFIEKLKDSGYIRKSPLVELVEEAEGEYKKWLTRTDDNMSETMVMDKFNKALQALKKDHPDFRGKK